MRKLFIPLAFVLMHTTVFASGNVPLSSLSADERARLIEERTGGMIWRGAEGRQLIVVDGRSKVGKVLNYLEQENHKQHPSAPGLPIKSLATGINPNEAISHVVNIRDAEHASLVIAIVSGGDNLLGLTIHPEDRIAIINADKYGNRDFLLLKEIWRAIGFIGGVGYSQYSADVMQPAFSSADIESITGTTLLPSSLNSMAKFNECFGIKRAFSMPYIAAVHKGWAPPPTNEVQKAIWDKVHAIPAKPMKIEFDPKKGR